MIKFAAIVPHPPLIIPGIGNEQDRTKVKNTIDAMENLSEKIADAEIDTIIIISPHGTIYPDRMNVWSGGEFYGNFDEYKNNKINFDFISDDTLAEKITDTAESQGIKINEYRENFKLDHGVTVPMYYLKQHLADDVTMVPMNYSMSDRLHHYGFGQIIAETLELDQFKDKNVAIIASGDLSHRLLESEEARTFDKSLINDLNNKNFHAILDYDEDIIEDAGECAYRSILILLGAIEKYQYEPKILSYEGPLGIGYLVANFEL